MRIGAVVEGDNERIVVRTALVKAQTDYLSCHWALRHRQ